MDQKDILHQMIKFNQAFFNNTFEAAIQLQDKVELFGNTIMERADWLPGQTRSVYDNFVETYRASCNHFKSYVDEGYQQTERLFK